MSDDEQRAQLLRQMAEIDQEIQDIDDSMVNVTLTGTIFGKGVDQINALKETRAKVEAQLKQFGEPMSDDQAPDCTLEPWYIRLAELAKALPKVPLDQLNAEQQSEALAAMEDAVEAIKKKMQDTDGRSIADQPPEVE